MRLSSLLFILMLYACEIADKSDFTYKVLSPRSTDVFQNGEVIHIEVEVSNFVTSAEFYFDHEQIGTCNDGLVELSWTPAGQSGGIHNLRIKMYPADFEPVSINIPLVFEYSAGEPGQGGIIFFLDETGMHGLAAATSDAVFKDKNIFYWGPEIFIGATDTANGSSNTAILSHSSILASYAWPAFKFGYIHGGYDDWYVGSKTEMLKLLEFVSTTESDLSMNKSYWTSTECCRALACAVDYSSQKAITCLKADSLFRIRPVRKF